MGELYKIDWRNHLFSRLLLYADIDNHKFLTENNMFNYLNDPKEYHFKEMDIGYRIIANREMRAYIFNTELTKKEKKISMLDFYKMLLLAYENLNKHQLV